MSPSGLLVGPVTTNVLRRVPHWLGDSEMGAVAAAPGHLRDRLGRSHIAAKLAVLAHQRATGQTLSPPRSIAKVTAPSGAPRAVIPGGVDEVLHLSVAHGGQCTYAIASGRPVGLDVEPARELPSEHLRYIVSPAEGEEVTAALPGRAHAGLVAWVIKESVLKWAGIGLTVPPSRARITYAAAISRRARALEGHAHVRIVVGSDATAATSVGVRWWLNRRGAGAIAGAAAAVPIL